MEDLELKIIENEYRKRKLVYNPADDKQKDYLSALRDQINISKSPDFKDHVFLVE
ncbi:MAG: hypothetical protein ACW98K_00585 [Candidatus Kariarchaeaceae archaeon]|jgi:hypothetical protein